ARRRRRVTARVSIRPPDKRLLDPDDPPPSRGSLTRDVMAPPRSTRRPSKQSSGVYFETWRRNHRQARVIGRNPAARRRQPAQRHAGSYRETQSINRAYTIHRARFTSCNHVRTKEFSTASKILHGPRGTKERSHLIHVISFYATKYYEKRTKKDNK
ncbi:hypothetical protein DBV15_04756, partial [Temnothorax longispinosus]